jgi:DNA-binding response OmpR family regulator
VSPLQVILTVHGLEADPYHELQAQLHNDDLVRLLSIGQLADLTTTLAHELPDLVLVHTPSLALADTTIAQVCQSIRAGSSLDYRPVIVLHTGDDAGVEAQRIEYFIHGADDVLPHDLSHDELRVRLLAHLRRHLDTLTTRTTQLPNQVLLTRMLDRALNHNEPWALLLGRLKHFEAYQEAYGRVPAQQLLKTLARLLGNLVRPPDWSSHLDGNQFGMLTTPDKAERLAGLLCRQFDSVAHTFYSEQDVNRGYIVAVKEGSTSKVPLVTFDIGIVQGESQAFADASAILTSARDVLRQLPRSVHSQWGTESLKLASGACPNDQGPDKQTVLVVENDAAMAFLLKTTLEMQGVNVEVAHDAVETLSMVQDQAISLVIMDSLIQNEPVGWSLCQAVKQMVPKLPVLMVSTVHNRDEALRCGADVYVPRPFELIPFLTLVNQTLANNMGPYRQHG